MPIYDITSSARRRSDGSSDSHRSSSISSLRCQSAYCQYPHPLNGERQPLTHRGPHRRVWYIRRAPLILTLVLAFLFGGIVSEFVQAMLPVSLALLGITIAAVKAFRLCPSCCPHSHSVENFPVRRHTRQPRWRHCLPVPCAPAAHTRAPPLRDCRPVPASGVPHVPRRPGAHTQFRARGSRRGWRRCGRRRDGRGGRVRHARCAQRRVGRRYGRPRRAPGKRIQARRRHCVRSSWHQGLGSCMALALATMTLGRGSIVRGARAGEVYRLGVSGTPPSDPSSSSSVGTISAARSSSLSPPMGVSAIVATRGANGVSAT